MRLTDEEARAFSDERFGRALEGFVARRSTELVAQLLATNDANTLFSIQGRLAGLTEIADLIRQSAKNRR